MILDGMSRFLEQYIRKRIYINFSLEFSQKQSLRGVLQNFSAV